MIDIEIRKCQSSGIMCDNPKCKRLPENFDRVLSSFFIKEGVIYAAFFFSTGVDYYCRSCIDDVYQMIKSKMNSKLWVFQ